MKPLSNPRHEAFAQARFSGLGVMEAYRTAGYVGELPQLATKVSQHPEVKARIMELHNAAATVVRYEKLDVIKDLVSIIKARPSEASPEHPLCEVRTGRQGQYHRFPSKLRAMARLAKIMGWDEPLKVEIDAEDVEPDRMMIKLQEIRTQGRVPSAAQEPPEERVSDDPNAPLTPLQEAFAQGRFLGMGVMEAYKAAGYTGDSPQRASRVNHHPAVKARIAQLRKAAEDALPYKKYEAVNDLIAIIHASPSEASADNPLCEMRMGHEGPYYRLPCKLAAIMQLVRLMGWNQPEKVQVIPGVKKMDNWDRFIQCINARYAADSERQAKEREKHDKAITAQTASDSTISRS
jgi:hypothetical protein